MSIAATVLSLLIGLLLVWVGARFLLSPAAAAAGYGVPAEPGPYLTIKGVRDGVYGLLVLVLLATGERHALGWFLLVATVAPLADAVIVLRNGGSAATAFGIHAVTAVVMVVTAVLLLAR
jgi:hypothetical protein